EGQEARGRVRPYARQEVADSPAAETADHVPALHAHVPRVLRDFGQRADLIERVFAGFLDQAGNGQRPGVQIDAGIVIVVSVVGESLEGSQFGVRKRRRRPPALEQLARGPVAESNSATEKPLLERRNREGPCQQDWTQLEQLAASKLLELTAFNRRLHQNTPGVNRAWLCFCAVAASCSPPSAETQLGWLCFSVILESTCLF